MKMQNRRPLAKVSMFGVTYLHRQNPYLIAWWSAAFPGFGQFLCNQYIRATLLTLFEVIINTLAHVNEAIVFMFCGKFDMSISVLRPRWAVGYIIIYIYTIWDSFQTTIVQNKMCDLAEFENDRLSNMYLSSFEIQYIEQKNPFTAAAYSFFFPGLGQLYNHRFGLAFYTLFWVWFYITYSHTYESMLYLFIGKTQESITIIHPHWLMFLPSIVGGATYHAFITAIEHNRLFQLEQRQFLTERYLNSNINIFYLEGVDNLLITGTFEHSLELEQALAQLEKNGIARKHIKAISMDKDPNSPDQLITKNRELHYRAFEVGMASATACSVVGTSIGFILKLGPIFWGLFTAIIGFIIGFGLYLIFKKRTHRNLSKHLPEVLLNVYCKEEQTHFVMKTMLKYNALTVGKTSR